MQVLAKKGLMTAMVVAGLMLPVCSGCSEPPGRVYRVARGPSNWRDRIGPMAAVQGPYNQADSWTYNEPLEQRPSWQKPVTMAPATAVMSDSDSYHIGPGDELEITIYQLTELDKDAVLSATVDPAGRVYLPVLDHVQVNGMSCGQVRKLLLESLGRQFIRDPRVDVRIREYGSKAVDVVGKVGRPGTVHLESDNVQLMDLITKAGGIAEGAGPDIEIWRPARAVWRQGGGAIQGSASYTAGSNGLRYMREVIPIDMLFGNAGEQFNPPVYPGDVVKIASGSDGYVYVSGEVKRGGSLAFRRPFNLLQAIATAGGITNVAAEKKCQVVRITPNGREQVIDVDLERVRQGTELNLMLARNDTILVPVDPVKKFFDDIDKLIRRGVIAGVDLTYDAAEGMGWTTGPE